MDTAGTGRRRPAPRRRRGHWRSAAVAVAVALGLLAGASLTACRPIAGCDVAVVGDSLTVGAAPYLPEALAGRGCRLAWVNARTGRGTAEGVRIIQAAAADGSLPPVLVVALGTNDGADPAWFAAQIDAVMAAAGPGRAVVWTDIAHLPVRGPLNLALFLKDVQYPNLMGAPWNDAYWSNSSWRAGDAVHATAAGYSGRAQVTANTVLGVIPPI